MIKNRILYYQYVFRGPIWFIVTITLTILPHFATDYGQCYVQLRIHNQDATLFGFIQHVLIEKIASALISSLSLFGALYVLSMFMDRYAGQSFGTRLKQYVLFSLPLLSIMFVVQWIAQVPVLSYFSQHHLAETNTVFAGINLVAYLYFLILGYTLVAANLAYTFLSKTVEKLNVFSTSGRSAINVSDISHIEKEGSLCNVTAGDKVFQSNIPIKRFLKILNQKDFIQVNRASIVRRSEITSFNYWENHKYIIYVGESKKQFVVTRARMKQLKDAILNNSNE